MFFDNKSQSTNFWNFLKPLIILVFRKKSLCNKQGKDRSALTKITYSVSYYEQGEFYAHLRMIVGYLRWAFTWMWHCNDNRNQNQSEPLLHFYKFVPYLYWQISWPMLINILTV